MTLTALAINCTLKPTPADSSCALLLGNVLSELERHGGQWQDDSRRGLRHQARSDF
ncbi:hypothetical protein SAMN04487955_102315 [Halomonas korlensis]|uniref:Uncharacterized protein n=1 Tax=Halomonas korlensis TaxID=463301 RepID=A0A1I7G7H9_9GAMM|nr:hypothetical protein SAMN04487955_102315 [Halomonas korlensis]